MQTILIVIHLMVVLALVGVVLLQRSEGGGLGIGGGSGFMTARGAANALTRATAILAAGFFATSLALSIYARYYAENPIDILDRVPVREGGAPTGSGGVLDQLGGSDTPAEPTAPAEPAAPTGAGSAPAQSAPAAPMGAAPAAPTDVAPAAPTGIEPAAPAEPTPASPTDAAPAAPTDSAPAAPAQGPRDQ